MTRASRASLPAALLTIVLTTGPAIGQGTAEDSLWYQRGDPPQLAEPIHKVWPDSSIADQYVEGRVGVQALIGTDGRVKNAYVSSSLLPMLDEAAVKAARQWLFKPAHDLQGEPIENWVMIPITFKTSPPVDAAHAEFVRAMRELREQIIDPHSGGPGAPSERDEAIRERVIRLALGLNPPPTTGDDVRTIVHRARAELDRSGEDSFRNAMIYLTHALLRAPWFADAYLETARAYEVGGRPANAAVALRLYLIADSTSSQRSEIERRLKKLGQAARH